MSLVKDYFLKTSQWAKEYGENSVVFMQVGAFFEVYGLKEDDGTFSGSRITDVCAICDLTIANKSSPNSSDKQSIKMAGFRDHQLDKYLKKMNDVGWTCIVYTQDEATKNTTRSLHGIYSPGTFFNEESTSVSNHTMTVWIEKTNSSSLRMNGKTFIGIAIVDIFTGRTYISEYETDEKHNPSTYDDLERTVSIYNPAEVIIITSFDNNKTKEIIQFTGINENRARVVNLNNKNEMCDKAKKCQKQSYQSQTLTTFFNNDDMNIENIFYDLQSNVYGLQSMIFLLNYIYSHNPNLAKKIEIPVIQLHSNRLLLANHSLKQLNMISDNQHTNPNLKNSCVSSLLNSAVTAGGKRTFSSLLNNPVCDEEYLQRQYDITECFLSNDEWYFIRDELKDVKDIEKLNRKLVLKRFTPRDISIIYNSITRVEKLFNQLKNRKSWKNLNNYLQTCNVNNIDCTSIIGFIENLINIEEASLLESYSFNQYSADCVNKGTCFVKQNNYNELDETCNGGLIWKEQINAIVSYLDKLIAKTETKAKSKLVKLHETPTMPMTILLTKKRSATLKLELQKLKIKKIKLCKNTNAEFTFDIESINIENASSKSDDIVCSPQINDLTYKLRNIKDNLNEVLSNVFKDICQKLTYFSENITHIANFVRYMDLIQARCYLASRYGYCKPIIEKQYNDSGASFVKIKGLRHPLIEHIQTNELYVTNDINLGTESIIDESPLGILLYGTNAVGKTSLIKALGISVIMAQAGLYVPCTSFNYRPYKSIFTRILGNDNIHRGLSTFAVEMIELRTILKMTDNRSLILGDELCSGTESDSALSIFTAGIEKLHDLGSNFIFATHFHEIVEFDEIKTLNGVKAKHMTVVYNRELDTLVYDRKLKDGPGDSMYGLEVCKALDLPSSFLDRAHTIRNKYNRQTNADIDMKTSHFNNKKIMGRCEICDKTGTEVHHLQHQKYANEQNRIRNFHKNHIANLITLCEECHNEFHKTDTQYKRKKTTSGYKLLPVTE
jgi:DNA mismatch repair protein MutS